jgi:putative ABC transport system permease protein
MSRLVRDARFALRLLRRSPGFTAVAVLALALGIGATTSIFSLVYGVFLAPLPYRDADRLVMVWPRFLGEKSPAALRDYLEWRRRATSFSDLNAWGMVTVTLDTGELPEKIQGGIATPGFLAMLGYGQPLALGRTFHLDEGVPGRDRVAVLTWRLWQERFAGDPQILGRPIRLGGGIEYTVVGVLGAGPADRQQCQLWLPLDVTPGQPGDDARWLNVTGRLKPGVTVEQGGADLATVVVATRRAQREDPGGWSASVEPFRNSFLRDSTRQGLWLLLGAVALLLLIACVNVANLLLARSAVRQHEIAVRRSLGATRAVIVRQLLTESAIIAAVGGVLGVLLAGALLAVVRSLMPAFTLPSEADIRLSVPVLLFAVAVCTAAGLAAGCAPAWQVSRTELKATLDTGRAIAGRRGLLRRSLIVVEFALALTLLAAAGATVRAFARLVATDPGFRTERLLTFSLGVPDGRLPTVAHIERFHRDLQVRLGVLPGVESVAVSTDLPQIQFFYGQRVLVVGRPVAPGAQPPEAAVNMVSPSYYRTYGIPILRGRAFDDRDSTTSAPVAIVNQAFADRYLAGLDPLKVRLSMPPATRGDGKHLPPAEWQVVGVYGTVRNDGPNHDPVPQVDLPFWQDAFASAMIAIRLRQNAPPVMPDARAIVHTADPTVSISDVRMMESVVSESVSGDRFHAVLFTAFAGAALLLAIVGVYGVMSSVVQQRTREIGLRMALGAGPPRMLRDVLRDGMASALAGTVVGLAGAWASGRALSGLIYGVEPADPMLLAIVSLTLAGAAFAACLVPARRAAAVDPLVALRHD